MTWNLAFRENDGAALPANTARTWQTLCSSTSLNADQLTLSSAQFSKAIPPLDKLDK